MAVNLFNEYPQNTQAPNEDYPFGAFRNRTAPEAADGTTLEEKWSNDWQAFFSRLFIEASMTPSGEVDTVKVSQYYDALLAIIQREKVEVSNALNGTRTDVAASEDALRLAYELASAAVKRSGDTMTGGLIIQNAEPMVDLYNSSIPGNNVGSKVVLWNNAGNPTVTTTNRGWSGTAFNQVFPRKSGTIALENTAKPQQTGWSRDSSTGIITQWGRANIGDNQCMRLKYPVPFENDCFSLICSAGSAQLLKGSDMVSAYGISHGRHEMTVCASSNNDHHGIQYVNWLAIGK